MFLSNPDKFEVRHGVRLARLLLVTPDQVMRDIQEGGQVVQPVLDVALVR